MKTSEAPVGRLGITLLILIVAALAGCTTHQETGASRAPDNRVEERDPLEVSCEVALMQLGDLLAERSGDRSFSAAVLVEAKELHNMGRELYLEGEFSLALELVEQGIRLLKEESG